MGAVHRQCLVVNIKQTDADECGNREDGADLRTGCAVFDIAEGSVGNACELRQFGSRQSAFQTASLDQPAGNVAAA